MTQPLFGCLLKLRKLVILFGPVVLTKGGTETSRSSQKWDLLPLIYGILTQILDMLVMADLAIDFIFTILA